MKLSIVALAVLSIFMLVAVINAQEDLLVALKNGTVRGTTTQSRNGRPIYAFKGIPYAKAPVGPLRFQPPEPYLDGWGTEILDGTRTPPACAQVLTALSPASEDCLFVSVYTPIKPGTDDTTKLPVMFFVHGGAFMLGDSVIYGPNKLLSNDVILVVFHYRLGALGFLSTGDEVVPGNNGMKDQVQALKWVQENIEAFNGDPGKVTIFGESAGSASVLYLMISPLAQGLFHSVIAQSGSPLSIWASDKTPVKSAQRYAQTLNCPTTTSKAMVDCLRTKSWQELATQSITNLAEDIINLKILFEASAPVIEPDLPGAFISKDPLYYFRDGEAANVPVMLGANQHEGSAILAAAYVVSLQYGGKLDDPIFVRDELLPTLLKAIGTDESTQGMPLSQQLAILYFPEGSQRDNFTEITDGLVDMLSVSTFKASILHTADLLSRHNDKVYFYSFEKEGINSLWTLLFNLLGALLGQTPPPIKHGVMHGDDLQYFFTLPFIVTGKDKVFSEMVCKMWTDFATNSDPTPTPSPTLPKWETYSIAEPNYYKLDVEPELLSDYTSSWRNGYSK